MKLSRKQRKEGGRTPQISQTEREKQNKYKELINAQKNGLDLLKITARELISIHLIQLAQSYHLDNHEDFNKFKFSYINYNKEFDKVTSMLRILWKKFIPIQDSHRIEFFKDSEEFQKRLGGLCDKMIKELVHNTEKKL